LGFVHNFFGKTGGRELLLESASFEVVMFIVDGVWGADE
jgi:hypothetical protein